MYPVRKKRPARLRALRRPPASGFARQSLWSSASDCAPRLDELCAAFHALEEELGHWRASEDHKQGLIDKLHAELQTHKRGLVREAVKPYLMILIQMHDSLGRMVDHLAADDANAGSAALIRSVQEDLELAMAQQGIHPFSEPGDLFVPARQTSLGVTATETPEQAGHIAERLRPGFEQGAVLLCKERVRVYALAPKKRD